VAARRRLGAALGAIGLLVGLFPAPAALAADPGAGFSATWTVTPPAGVTRAADSIAVGDDFSVSFAALDATPVTSCRVRVYARGGEMMESPGFVADGACGIDVRIPDFPEPTVRARIPADDPARDLCVWPLLMTFADGQERLMRDADHLEPAGRVCNDAGSSPGFTGKLDFRIDEGGQRRQFESNPKILSWDPADWGTGMQPFAFGSTWHYTFPDWVTDCRGYLNGDWVTAIAPRDDPGCESWDVRVPGVLPSTLPWGGDPGTWSLELASYYYSGPGQQEGVTLTAQRTQMASSDGVFESNLRAIFPVDLASTRFVHAGDPWLPVYQVTGGDVDACFLTRITIPPTWPNDDLIQDRFTGTADADNHCSFELPPLADGERHQYFVTVAFAGEPERQDTTFSGDINGIPPSTPPVIAPPTEETGGDTGIGVDPGQGNGLVVDVSVSGTTASAATGKVSAAVATPTCTDRAIAPDLSTGGGIPHLDARCPLAPGSYQATATMVDAAGVKTTSKRTFTVSGPKVSARTPGPGATGVARDAQPTVGFDRAVTGVSASTIRLQNVATSAFVAATVTYDTTLHRATLKPSALLAAGAAYRVSVSASIKSATGFPVTASTWTFTVTTDAIAPTPTAPQHTLAAANLGGGLLPVRLATSATDPSGIRGYELSQQTDGGPWATPVASSAASLFRNLASGHTYRFRARATDKSGNTGPWTYGIAFRLTGIQQTSSAIHYTGTWGTLTSSTSWWGGSAKTSTTAGSTATYRFTGRSFAWVGLTSPTRGKARVYVDGVLRATVDLYSAATVKQRILWSVNYATSAARTVRIQVLGTAGRPRVEVDGFIVAS
jgi:hypothetical protein